MTVLRMSLLVVLAGCPTTKPDDGPLVDTGDTEDTDDTDDTDPSDCESEPAGEGTGQLVLDLVSPPALDWRQAPVVVIYAADGSEVGRAEASTTLDLPNGIYTVEALRGETVATSVVGELWTADVPIASLCVPDGGSEDHAVTWSEGEGHLWVSSGESIGAFTGQQLEDGGPHATVIRLDMALINDFRGFGFDRMGHLWAASSPTYGTRLLWFSPGRIGGQGEKAPDAELTSPVFQDFAGIDALEIDEAGTLWVALRSADLTFRGLVGFSRATLGGALLGGVNVEVEPDYVRLVELTEGPMDLERGVDGAMWMTSYDTDTILRIDDPTADGTGADAVFTVYGQTLPSDPVLLRGPDGLAFKDNGDAVALFWTSGALLPIDGGALAGVGAQDLVVASDGIYVDQLPSGLAIDGVGNVWLGNYAGTGVGQVLTWTEGSSPEPWLLSDELPDPRDLVLDPRPR